MHRATCLLVLILALILAACGGGTPSPAPSAAQPTAAQAPAAQPSQPPAPQPTAAPKATDVPKPAATPGPISVVDAVHTAVAGKSTVTVADILYAMGTVTAQGNLKAAPFPTDISPAGVIRTLMPPGVTLSDDDLVKGFLAYGFAEAAAGRVPTGTPAPAPKAAPVGKVGEPVEVNGIRLTVHKVEVKADLGQFTKAKEGRAFVVVEVTIENTGQNQHSANPFNLTLRDANGQSYSQSFGSQDPLQLAQLVKGDKARGTVPFDVKADAKGLVLIYDTAPLANAAQQIRVDLGM